MEKNIDPCFNQIDNLKHILNKKGLISAKLQCKSVGKWKKPALKLTFNSQYRISLYNINTISSRQVMII